MPVTGNFDGIRKLKLSFAALPKASTLAALGAAPELGRMVQAEFAAGVGPDGAAWEAKKPSTIRIHGNKPLWALSGKVRGSTTATARGNYIKFSIGQSYANFNTGKRPIFPKLVLPASWQVVVRKHVEQAIKISMGGKA